MLAFVADPMVGLRTACILTLLNTPAKPNRLAQSIRRPSSFRRSIPVSRKNCSIAERS